MAPGKRSSQAVRKVCPDVNLISLAKAFESHVERSSSPAFDFGLYESIGRNCAVDPSGVKQNESLLLAILRVVPWCQVNPTILRNCISRHPRQNHSTLKTELWAGGRAEKITTMLKHLRRIKQDQERWRQAIQKATPAEADCLRRLMAHIDTDGYESEPERVLTEHVSLDSDGFPAMLKDIGNSEEQPTKGTAESSKPIVLPTQLKQGVTKDLFEGALQQATKAALMLVTGASAKPIGKAKKGKSQPMKRVTGKQPECNNAGACNMAKKRPASQLIPAGDGNCSLTWGKLWLTVATAQSYIQYLDPATQKKRLLIAVSKKMSEAAGKPHAEIIQGLYDAAKKADMTQEKLLALRVVLLK